MTAQPHLHTEGHPPSEPHLELVTTPITKTLADWARKTGIADGTTGEVTVEIVFDTHNGNVRRAIIHRKLGADTLDHLGQFDERPT